MNEWQIPILVGCGQVTQREPDPMRALAPIDLTAEAARLAAQDTGAGDFALRAIDTVVVVRSFADTSWRFASPFGRLSNPPKSLAERLDASRARRCIYTYAGGNMPQWCINRLFELISRGEIEAALIAGGEALATQKAAQRAGMDLDWSEDAGDAPSMWGIPTRGWSDVEDRHRMAGAIFAYPLFETGIRAHKKHLLKDHLAVMGQLFARFASVAAKNPLADRRAGYSADEIAAVGPKNPYIGFPYTKLMNANAFIDQAAAVIVMSLAKARQLGIPRDRWVFLHGCADANDHWYISDRNNFHSSKATRIVARETFAMANLSLDDMDHIDLYSCFPSAVEIACDEIGIAMDDPRGLTITGGLAYFGGPGNNYVTHAIAEMMDLLRARPGSKGLVTANGNYVTKHSAGIYSTDHPERPFAPKDPLLYQAEIDADPGPEFIELAKGPATVETYTVMHDRRGPSFAILFGRLTDGRRFIANTPQDGDLLRSMIEVDYVGRSGTVSASSDGRNIFVPT